MMSSSNSAFFLLIFSFQLSYCPKTRALVCPETEKQSLLSFQNSLEDPSNQLSSWDANTDCCRWKGVICSNSTGNVQQLRLAASYASRGLSGRLSPSLINLKQLEYIDLRYNSFTGTIPSFIGSFAKLQYLLLTEAGFQGRIPHTIGNLSNLRTLELETFDLAMDADSLEWLSGLSRLEYLKMNGVDLSRATEWRKAINRLHSLQQLRLNFCRLDSFADDPLGNVNVTSLTHLDLSGNYHPFAVPSWILQLPNLIYLDLSYNDLAGAIPSISNATKIQYIDLSANHLAGAIPTISNAAKIQYIDLSYNSFTGPIPTISNATDIQHIDLSGNRLSGKIPTEVANLCRIQEMHLSHNELQGEISDLLGDLSECFLGSLEKLSLQSNNLSGHLTYLFGNFKSLRVLDLANNSLSGAVPVSIGKLSSLEHLYIDDNMLTGVVTENHFANLAKLQTLSASRNHLSLNVSSNWKPPFQLASLKIGSWNLGGGSQIPSWLENQRKVEQLDLSNTGITGNRVPGWFWRTPFLDLSLNNLSGMIPDEVDCEYAFLSSNRFSGSLPRIGHSVRELDLSNNSLSGGISHFLCDRTNRSYLLRILHLGKNQLSGEFPDCWRKWPNVAYLNIGTNNISGSIPNSIGLLASLRSLNLDGNMISGQIPFSLSNCTNLLKINLARNEFDGSIPTWIGRSLLLLKVLILRSNKMSGTISSEICHLNDLQILDLSDNTFTGTIPECVYNFTAMGTPRRLAKSHYYSKGIEVGPYYSYSLLGGIIESASVHIKGSILQYDATLSLVTNIDLSTNNLSGGIPKELTRLVELRSLNLAGNHLTGLIPESIGNMKELESLDFSRNSLSGQIPNSLTLLSFITFLNLSNNNLSGRIPESTQLQSFDGSSFIGNLLCGPPLTSNCSHDGDEVNEQKEENESEIEWVYISISLGYAVGFSSVCTTLVLKKSWREAYFGFLQSMWDKFYFYVHIQWARFIKPSGART